MQQNFKHFVESMYMSTEHMQKFIFLSERFIYLNYISNQLAQIWFKMTTLQTL